MSEGTSPHTLLSLCGAWASHVSVGTSSAWCSRRREKAATASASNPSPSRLPAAAAVSTGRFPSSPIKSTGRESPPFPPASTSTTVGRYGSAPRTDLGKHKGLTALLQQGNAALVRVDGLRRSRGFGCGQLACCWLHRGTQPLARHATADTANWRGLGPRRVEQAAEVEEGRRWRTRGIRSSGRGGRGEIGAGCSNRCGCDG